MSGDSFAQELRRGNALIRGAFPFIEPEKLDLKTWSHRYNEAKWLEDRRTKELISLLHATKAF